MIFTLREGEHDVKKSRFTEEQIAFALKQSHPAMGRAGVPFRRNPLAAGSAEAKPIAGGGNAASAHGGWPLWHSKQAFVAALRTAAEGRCGEFDRGRRAAREELIGDLGA
jgi:hypothetical protein